MKHWRVAAIGVLIVAVVVGLGYWLTVGRPREGARRLLRAALEQGVSEASLAAAEIGTLSGSQFHKSAATIEYAGVVSRARVRADAGVVTLVDDGERVWQLDEGAKVATALSSSARQADWDLLLQNYRVLPSRLQTIGGVAAQGIRLVSRHSDQTVVEYWIDPDTRLILRRHTYNADGRLVASTELTNVAAAPGLTASDLRVPGGWERKDPDDAARPVTLEEFTSGADFTPQFPSYVPDGFQESGLFSLICPNGRAYAELRYFDGLRVISIHEHRPRRPVGAGGGRGAGRGSGRRRADRQPVLIDEGRAKTVRYRRDDLRIIVSGDLPAEEVLKVLESIPRIPS